MKRLTAWLAALALALPLTSHAQAPQPRPFVRRRKPALAHERPPLFVVMRFGFDEGQRRLEPVEAIGAIGRLQPVEPALQRLVERVER